MKLKILGAVTERGLEEAFNEFMKNNKGIEINDTTFFATNVKFFAFITYS